MATYYLNPQLATGLNDGTSEANAWQSWETAVAAINSAHANMVTDTEGVDVYVSGSQQTLTGNVDFTFVASSTYPCRFFGVDPTPAVFSTSKPGVKSGSDFTAGPYLRLNTAGGATWIEFHDLNFHQELTRYFFRHVSAAGAGSRVRFVNCFIRGRTTGSTSHAFFDDSSAGGMATVEFSNCIIDAFVKGGSGFNRLFENIAGQDGAHELLNCSVPTGSLAFHAGTGINSVRMLNCLLAGDFNLLGTHGTVAGGHNVTALSQAATTTDFFGTNNVYDASFSFVSATDAHLTAANTWGAGPSDGTFGSFVPTTDIDGDTRSGATTSAGADEIAASSGPVISTGTITTVTAAGFQVQFTTDTANGTAYYVVYPTSATDPTAVQIVAETDGDDGAALASGNQAVSTTGVQTFSPAVTGLSPNTTYRVSVVHYGTPA